MKKLLLLTALLLLSSLSAMTQTPDPSAELIDKIPNLIQTDRRANLPDGGKMYCAPVAVSDSLMWLGLNGYPRLIPSADDAFTAQVTMARILGSRDFMNVDLDTGTSPSSIIRGVVRYSRVCGYGAAPILYTGWRTVDPPYRTGVTLPQRDWLRLNLRKHYCVWLNIGWYRYDPAQDLYLRQTGHWVTLVGYGQDEKGKHNADILIVHDPLERKGKVPSNTFLTITTLTSGTLVGKQTELPRSAAGYFKVAGMSQEETAILDGVIVLQVHPTETGP